MIRAQRFLRRCRLPVALAILVVVLFGCLGAFLSTQRRLQQPSEGGDPLIAILGLYEFNNIKRFPLIAGGLFATVLYFILMAGFLKGDLFPELPAGIPQGAVSWAKLVIWAFLSGFAERLVPDTLDRLVNEVQPRVPVSPPSSGPTDTGRPAERVRQEDVKSAEQAQQQKAAEPPTKDPVHGVPPDASKPPADQGKEHEQGQAAEDRTNGPAEGGPMEEAGESKGASGTEEETRDEQKQETPK